MKKKKNYRDVRNKTDKNLAASYPTANSHEFVPKPTDDIKVNSPVSSEEIFDFIPQPKNLKYK